MDYKVDILYCFKMKYKYKKMRKIAAETDKYMLHKKFNMQWKEFLPIYLLILQRLEIFAV